MYKTQFGTYAIYGNIKCVGVLIGGVFTDFISSCNLNLLDVCFEVKGNIKEIGKTFIIFPRSNLNLSSQ